MNQIPHELRKRFRKIYEDNNGFKMDWSLFPEETKEQWLSIGINTRIKIAKIYAISNYLDMVCVGLSKRLFSEIRNWTLYDEIENWIEENVYCYMTKSSLPKLDYIYNNRQQAIEKIRDIIKWPN